MGDLRRAVAALLALLSVAACSHDHGSPSTTTTGPSSTTTSSTTTTTAASAAYGSTVRPVSAEELGASWRPGCPVPPEDLRAVELTYWGFDEAPHRGTIVVAADLAEEVAAIFADLFAARFPIERVEPISVYGGDDQASMAANNTSAFNCRTVAGTSRLSEHAFGRAVDLNPLRNPYVRADGTVDPVVGAPFADRTRTDPGIIHDGDAAVTAFAARGWVWGGHWRNGKDYQHFSTTGR